MIIVSYYNFLKRFYLLMYREFTFTRKHNNYFRILIPNHSPKIITSLFINGVLCQYVWIKISLKRNQISKRLKERLIKIFNLDQVLTNLNQGCIYIGSVRMASYNNRKYNSTLIKWYCIFKSIFVSILRFMSKITCSI